MRDAPQGGIGLARLSAAPVDGTVQPLFPGEFGRGNVLGFAGMAAPRVLIIDDNQTFGQQVVAAFDDVGLSAVWVARAGEALARVEPYLQANDPLSPPPLCIVDLVRPASGGRAILNHLHGPQTPPGRAPLCLALVPVIGSYHDLPEGVEVQVKPIFPSQVVATARRLLGLAPAVSGRPLSGAAVHRMPATTPVALPTLTSPHAPLPSSGAPGAAGPRSGAAPAMSAPGAAGDSTIQLDRLEDLVDFGPADTLLAPAQSAGVVSGSAHAPVAAAGVEELARALSLGGSDPALEPLSASADPAPSSVSASARPRTKPQFPALSSGDAPAAAGNRGGFDRPEGSDVHTVPFSRSLSVGDVAPGIAAVSAALLADPGPSTVAVPLASMDDLAVPRAPAASGNSGPVAATLGGDLAAIPLCDIVALIARQRQTGVLRVRGLRDSMASQATVVDLFFRDGRIDLATAQGLPALRLGHFVLKAAAVSQIDIDEVAARLADAPPDGDTALLGLRLVQAGLIHTDALGQALTRQTTELLFAALSLPAGQFTFGRCSTADLPARVRDAALGGALGLDAESLLLEGYRRLRDRMGALRDAEEGAVYLATAAAGVSPSRLGLSDVEAAVLALCNGRLTVTDLARDSKLPLPDVARALSRLQALRLVRRRLPALFAS